MSVYCICLALAEVLKIKLVEPHQLSLFKQPLAQIEQAISEPNQPPVKLYYVHYIDYNKRLDEWVTIDRMRLDKIQAPITASSGGGSLSNSYSAQSHLCNISNSKLKELSSGGVGSAATSAGTMPASLKHDLSSSDEHVFMPPKKKLQKSRPSAAAQTQQQQNIHGSMSVPVNLASKGGSTRPSAAPHTEVMPTAVEHTPTTPSSAQNENADG